MNADCLLGFNPKHLHCSVTEVVLCLKRVKCWHDNFILKHVPLHINTVLKVGDGYADHGYWGRPENMNMARPAYKVNAGCHGSDVAGDTAAAMASGYLVFKDICGGLSDIKT